MAMVMHTDEPGVWFSYTDALNESRTPDEPDSDDMIDMADEFAAMAAADGDDSEDEAQSVTALHCSETLEADPFEEFMDCLNAFNAPSRLPDYAKIQPRPRVWMLIVKHPGFGRMWIAYPTQVVERTMLSVDTQCPIPRGALEDQTFGPRRVAMDVLLSSMVDTTSEVCRRLTVGTWSRALFPDPACMMEYTKQITDFADQYCTLLDVRPGNARAAMQLAWLRARDGRATRDDHQLICNGYRHRYLREMRRTHMLYQAAGFGFLDHRVWDQPDVFHEHFGTDAILSISMAST